ncbi:MAG: hypothetical protein ABI321_05255 [Polyangia bacterium]
MLSADARVLLDRACNADGPLELEGTPAEADRIATVLRHASVDELGERGLWNVLFAAGELSRRVDVYRAHELFLGATSLVERAGQEAIAGSPRAVTVEMAFDFFFARARHPLVPLRARDIVDALARLIAHGTRSARRAAIHGLGHLIEHGGTQAWVHDAVAQLDGLVAAGGDIELTRYAEEARTGMLR